MRRRSGLARRPVLVLVAAVAMGLIAVTAPLVVAMAARRTPPPTLVTLTIDASGQGRAISPLIYGVAAGDDAALEATGATLNRWGGNANTRYNWTLGAAWNAARDWEFRNYGGAQGPSSSIADKHVADSAQFHATPVMSMPAVGWIARDGDTETRSLDVPSTGGPPLASGADAISGYDPTRNRAATSVRSVAHKASPNEDVVAQDEWVKHLAQLGVHDYVIDNEPDLWAQTHTDVHPVEMSYDDMLANYLEYAAATKDADPQARVYGPALSGWTALLYSARDRGTDNYRTHADRKAHGDMPFLPWWLDQVRKHDEATGRRTLDVLDVHVYPQGQGVFSGATDEQTNKLRLAETRVLWDPTYTDESWIRDRMQLIPRLRAWIDEYYPGTLLAINEWNWGADETMNGALAIANVLGIFGREGVDMAAYWTYPRPGSPGAFAFKLFTQYFGDLSLAASSDHPDDVSLYASRHSGTGAVTIVAINQRTDTDLPVIVQGVEGTPRVTRLDAGSVEDLGEQSALRLPASSISVLNFNATPQ